MDEIRVLSPTAILGYGYPRRSLDEGMRRDPHVIAVDAGSTDGGPYYLGIESEGRAGGGRADGGQASAFMETISRDVGPLLEAALAYRGGSSTSLNGQRRASGLCQSTWTMTR